MNSFAHCGCGIAACGCCAGIETSTPKSVGSPPGHGQLSVRIGRHGDFLASMLAHLSSHVDADGNTPLKRLRTRQKDDLTISVLDAVAASGDILSFYNERIANEGYLATATEFRSLEALARLVGYRPQPGVAASVFLAFDIDPNTKDPVRIDQGLAVKTVPGQDELPQTFETSEAIEARAEWNKLGVRKTVPQIIDPNVPGAFWLAGTDADLEPGDALLIESPPEPKPVPVRVVKAIADSDANWTEVHFEPWMFDDRRLARLINKASTLGGDHVAAVIAAAENVQAMPYLAAIEGLQLLAADARSRIPRLGGSPGHQQLLEDIAKVSERIAKEISPRLDNPPPRTTFDDRLKILLKPPGAIPRSAARIERSAGDRFGISSTTALGVVAKAAPGAAAQLERAVAGHVAEAPASTQKVYAMRVRAGLFGRSFPKRMQALRSPLGAVQEIGEWPIIFGEDKNGWLGHEQPGFIMLDAVYEEVAPQSWLIVDMRAVDRPDKDNEVRIRPTESLLVTLAADVMPKIARGDYGGSGECTAIRLAASGPWIAYAKPHQFPDDIQPMINREFQLIRRTTVYAAPEELALAERPLEKDFCLHEDGDLTVELDRFYAGLEPGRYVIVSGERTDIPNTEGIFASEVAMIAGVANDVSHIGSAGARNKRPGDRVHTFVTFAGALSYCYKRDSVVIHGNVVKATHGETREELLGGGDAAKPNLVLLLKQEPLTFVASPTARGAEAALEVWVDDIRWHETEDLIDASPTDRIYFLRTAEGGKAEIQFGDGKEGARPSTGTQNVRSVYRTGIGRSGNAQAGQINQLVSRPAGLLGVVNPLPASGGADAEDRNDVRRNAPLMTMGLDRLVSVEDHASFARNFAGIAKARARMMTDGSRRFVHVTVAAEDDAPIDASSGLMVALKQAIGRYGDPFSPVILAPRELRLLIAAARIRIEPDRLWETVVAEIRHRLAAGFGFERREIASGLAASAVLAAIQATPGVDYVDLDVFGSIPTVEGKAGQRSPLGPERIADEIKLVTEKGVTRWEAAHPARLEAGGILPAELLLFAPDIPDSLILDELM